MGTTAIFIQPVNPNSNPLPIIIGGGGTSLGSTGTGTNRPVVGGTFTL